MALFSFPHDLRASTHPLMQLTAFSEKNNALEIKNKHTFNII